MLGYNETQGGYTMKRILLTIAILASTAQAGQAQQFPHDMVEKSATSGLKTKTSPSH